jgi:hypothetical protein
MDISRRVAEFCLNNPMLADEIMKVTDSLKIISKISENVPIFNVYRRADCQRFANITDAFFSLRISNILIYIAEIDLYGLFTLQNYIKFCRDINDKIEDVHNKINIYQIVLAEQKQKLVFTCNNANHYLNILYYSSECFGATAIWIGSTISIAIPCIGDSGVITAYNKLYNYIRNQGNLDCCESMKQIPLLQKCQYYYREYFCNDTLGDTSVEDLVKSLKYVPADSTRSRPYDWISSERQFAINWIQNNPPDKLESPYDYYQRYRSHSMMSIYFSHFNKIIRSQGYGISRNAVYITIYKRQ